MESAGFGRPATDGSRLVIQTILSGLLPIVFISCLGWPGGRIGLFDPRSTTTPRSKGQGDEGRDKSCGFFLAAAAEHKAPRLEALVGRHTVEHRRWGAAHR
jgi:hypothetical protein